MAPKKPTKKTGILALLLAAALLLSAAYYYFGPSEPGPVAGDQLAVHVIDVGQGDCILIGLEGRFMLIDGGERGNEDAVVKYLKAQGVERLDYVVATHPHSDHIGGLAYGVLDAFPAGTIIAPRLSRENTPATMTYETFLKAVKAQTQRGAKAAYANPGDIYQLGGAAFTILGPLKEDTRNHNNNSVVLRLAYGATAALFSGDAEKTVENALVKAYGEGLRADLLKAGHHGSNSSSTEGLLRHAAPGYAAISCGAENTYGHPDPRALQRLRSANIEIGRTDIEGTIVYLSDGNSFRRAA